MGKRMRPGDGEKDEAWGWGKRWDSRSPCGGQVKRCRIRHEVGRLEWDFADSRWEGYTLCARFVREYHQPYAKALAAELEEYPTKALASAVEWRTEHGRQIGLQALFVEEATVPMLKLITEVSKQTVPVVGDPKGTRQVVAPFFWDRLELLRATLEQGKDGVLPPNVVKHLSKYKKDNTLLFPLADQVHFKTEVKAVYVKALAKLVKYQKHPRADSVKQARAFIPANACEWTLAEPTVFAPQPTSTLALQWTAYQNSEHPFCATGQKLEEYWNAHAATWPELYDIAMLALYMPVGSVDCERAVGLWNRILGPHRHSLEEKSHAACASVAFHKGFVALGDSTNH